MGFLSDTIRSNFRKFITVIGWWDRCSVDDARDQRKPLEEARGGKALNVVQVTSEIPAGRRKVEQLTNADHLIPVSARWAMSKDTSQQKPVGNRPAGQTDRGNVLERRSAGAGLWQAAQAAV